MPSALGLRRSLGQLAMPLGPVVGRYRDGLLGASGGESGEGRSGAGGQPWGSSTYKEDSPLGDHQVGAKPRSQPWSCSSLDCDTSWTRSDLSSWLGARWRWSIQSSATHGGPRSPSPMASGRVSPSAAI